MCKHVVKGYYMWGGHRLNREIRLKKTDIR